MYFEPDPNMPEDVRFTPEPVYRQQRRQRCTHEQTEVVFPNGNSILVHSVWGQRRVIPDTGLYMDPAQFAKVSWLSLYLPWADRGLPLVPFDQAAAVITETFDSLEDLTVELGCYSSHGRAGVVVACMAQLAGVTDGVAWTRKAFCPEAIHTADQERFVHNFEGTVE